MNFIEQLYDTIKKETLNDAVSIAISKGRKANLIDVIKVGCRKGVPSIMLSEMFDFPIERINEIMEQIKCGHL